MSRQPAKAKVWTIKRRITLWFAVTTSVLVFFLATISVFAVLSATERELESLAEEELEEFNALISVADGTPSDFERIALELGEEHPGNRLAWRVWKMDTGETWGMFGRKGLFQRADPPNRLTSRQLASYDKSLRWRAMELTDELAVGILFDASPQLAIARTFVTAAIVFVPLSGLLATLAGSLLGTRISRMIRNIASEVRHIRAPGEEVEVHVTGAPEEVKQVAEALQEMLSNIRKEAESARLITSGLAHELRSPIQNLLGETEVAMLRERDRDEQQRFLESHQEELRELARAIDNLVTLCATEEGRRKNGAEHFNLGREAELRLARERSQAQRKNVDLQLSLNGNLDYEGDREALLLAIGNLVTNAIQWTEPGGTIRVVLAEGKDHLEITVDDQGPGVPVERRQEIFQPFFRSGTVDGRRERYGLGLALTRSAVERHRGSITVGDSPGGGARFRVLLPRTYAEAS